MATESGFPARPAPKGVIGASPMPSDGRRSWEFPRHPTWITEESPERISTMKKSLTEIRHDKVLAINLAEAEVLRWNNELEDDFSIYSRSYSALRVNKAEDNLREAKADLRRFDEDFKEYFAELDSRSKSEEREEISSSSDLEIGFDDEEGVFVF